MEWILCLIHSNQTLFVGLLGFVGVIITMLANAYLQRVQHKRASQHEKQSLRSALKAELTSNKQSYEHRIEQFNEPSGHDHALIQNKVQDKVYNTYMDSTYFATLN